MAKLSVEGIFDNSNTKKDGLSNVRFRFAYSEIPKWIRLLPSIGQQLPTIIKFDGTGEKIRLGRVQIKSINIDREGEAKVTVEGETRHMEISKLQLTFEKTFKVIFKLDEEEGDDDEE